jgi:hypothetical protein
MKWLKLYFTNETTARLEVSDSFNLNNKEHVYLDKSILMIMGKDGVIRYYNWSNVRMFKEVKYDAN